MLLGSEGQVAPGTGDHVPSIAEPGSPGLSRFDGTLFSPTRTGSAHSAVIRPKDPLDDLSFQESTILQAYRPKL